MVKEGGIFGLTVIVQATERYEIKKEKPLLFQPEPSVTSPNTSLAESLLGARTRIATEIATEPITRED